jgi:hypothetical protein
VLMSSPATDASRASVLTRRYSTSSEAGTCVGELCYRVPRPSCGLVSAYWSCTILRQPHGLTDLGYGGDGGLHEGVRLREALAQKRHLEGAITTATSSLLCDSHTHTLAALQTRTDLCAEREEGHAAEGRPDGGHGDVAVGQARLGEGARLLAVPPLGLGVRERRGLCWLRSARLDPTRRTLPYK